MQLVSSRVWDFWSCNSYEPLDNTEGFTTKPLWAKFMYDQTYLPISRGFFIIDPKSITLLVKEELVY